MDGELFHLALIPHLLISIVIMANVKYLSYNQDRTKDVTSYTCSTGHHVLTCSTGHHVLIQGKFTIFSIK